MQGTVSLESESWNLTIIRSQGLSTLRPERSWRPIIKMASDQQHHELILGCDGQNPNLKRPFYLSNVSCKSQIQFDVWYRSQSKKSNRKMHQVASACFCLEEIVRRQGSQLNTELRLSIPAASGRGQNIRGNHKNAACLVVRLQPPASYGSPSPSSSSSLTLVDVDERAPSLSDSEHSEDLPNIFSPPCTPTDDAFHPKEMLHNIEVIDPPKLRRRRVRGFSVNPDDDDEEEDGHSVNSDELPTLDDIAEIDVNCSAGDDAACTGWFAASLLPQYADQRSFTSTLSVTESTVSKISIYPSFVQADSDDDFAVIQAQLSTEWQGSVMVMLTSLGLVSAFYASQGTIDGPWMTRSIASATASACGGVVLGACLFFYCGLSEPASFKTKTIDYFDTYITFSILSRLPAMLCTLTVTSLATFMFSLSFAKWPAAGWAICGLLGICAGAVLGPKCVFLVIGALKSTRNMTLRWFSATSETTEGASSTETENDNIDLVPTVVHDGTIPPPTVGFSDFSKFFGRQPASTPPPRPPKSLLRKATRPRSKCS